MTSAQAQALAGVPLGVRELVVMLERHRGAEVVLDRPDSHLDALTEARILRRSSRPDGRVGYSAVMPRRVGGGDHERPGAA